MNADDLQAVLMRLLEERDALRAAGEAAGRYVRERVGATHKVTELVLRAL